MNAAEEKIKDKKELVEIVGELKKRGKVVVTTNGAFDLMHSGHVFLLEQAKMQGNVLIVGVNTDASVRAYKSKDRPIIPEQERAVMVAAVHCVDFVCLFNEPTCIEWLSEIKPNVHVKDSSAANENGRLIESDVVEKNAGKIFLVKRKESFSTTNIIEKILKTCCKK